MAKLGMPIDWQEHKDIFSRECESAFKKYVTDLESPARLQNAVLEDIIAISRKALHWREQKFSDVVTDQRSFRANLPIMRYEDFEPLLEREAQSKGGVLTCSPVMRWLKTSGTTGVPKRIPYTLHWLQRYRIPAMKVLWGNYHRHFPDIFSHRYAILDTQTVREDVSDYLHGVEHQAISNRHPKINEHDWNPPWYDEPWFSPSMPISHEHKMYHRIRNFIGKKLHCISAINPSTLISLREHLYKHRETLAAEVRDGTLDDKPFCAPNPELADHIARTLADNTFTLKDVWPELQFYSCWLTASAGLYNAKLDAIFPGVAKLPFMSCGSEGVTTIPVDDSAYSQPLAVGQAFFEFVPADVPLREHIQEGRKVPTLLFNQLEAGQEYHLIMSQGNGMYRMWTGDIYHVDRIEGELPWMHFIRRDGIFHSFTGEKLTEFHVTVAIENTFSAIGLNLGLYICGPSWGEPPHYVVMAETEKGPGEDAASIAARMDTELKKINLEYAAKRDSNRLDPVKFFTVPRDTIIRYVESKRNAANSNQYKYKPFEKNLDFLNAINGPAS